MIKTIYLAGPMEHVSEKEMCGWRGMAKYHLQGTGLAILDPTRRRHTFEERHMKRIFELDMMDIRDSDAIIVNLENPKLAKHGTAMEVFYASYVRRIPVLAFKSSKETIHPFFEALVTEWRSDIEKLCDTFKSEYLA